LICLFASIIPISSNPGTRGRNALPDDYIELFVKWTPNAVSDEAHRWFERAGLVATPMKSGAVLLGTTSQVEKAFSIALNANAPPASVPVPAELRDHVESITISKPRSYYS
jgi:hypothetical protein